MQANKYAHLGQMPDETLLSLGFKLDGEYWTLGNTKYYHILDSYQVAVALREDGAKQYKEKILNAIADCDATTFDN